MADNDDTPNQSVNLTPGNILGIIQRILAETNAYCMQAPQFVNPAVCMDRLHEAAMWVQRLPVAQQPAQEAPAPAANGGNGKRQEAPARKN